jgi:simple sugar transport system permease protein
MASARAGVRAAGASGGLARVWRTLSGRPETGALAATAALFIFFSLWADQFLTTDSLASTLAIAAELGIVAMAVTLLMIAGEFDLSVGSVLGMSSVLVAYAATNLGLPVPLAIIAGLAGAAAIGLLNGVLVATLRIPSFIVTLGALMFWRGVVSVITEGFPIDVPSSAVLEPFSHRFANGLNVSAFWFVLLMLVFAFLLGRSGFGNWVLAAGGNERAARGLGVPVDRVRITLFVLTALTAGLVGVIQAGRFQSVDANRGEGLELEAIAAAVIGGARLTGGYGSVIGTALGCLMVGMIRNGLALAGVASYWYTAIIGLLVVLAVVVNQAAGRTRPRTGGA